MKQDCYSQEIPIFNEIIESIGKKHGWTRKDIQARFSNKVLDTLFFSDLLSDNARK